MSLSVKYRVEKDQNISQPILQKKKKEKKKQKKLKKMKSWPFTVEKAQSYWQAGLAADGHFECQSSGGAVCLSTRANNYALVKSRYTDSNKRNPGKLNSWKAQPKSNKSNNYNNNNNNNDNFIGKKLHKNQRETVKDAKKKLLF